MHITLVDCIIVVLAIGALVRGYQIGFIRQFSSTIGFVLALYPGALLSSIAMKHVGGPSKAFAGLAVLLTVCFGLMTIMEIFAVRLKYSIRSNLAQRFDNVIGCLISVVTLMLGLWLASALFQLGPPNALQGKLKDSQILSTLARKLPPASAVLSSLNKLVDPNQSPQVFAGREPSPTAKYPPPDPDKFQDILAGAKESVVKIEGLGCGGIVDGSGFVYDADKVVTNAHVIAGVASPKVIDARGVHNTTVVLFDAANDLAVLQTSNLAGKPLELNTMRQANGSEAFALGYPGGKSYTVEPAVVVDTFRALGRDIYGRQNTTRDVYGLQSVVVRGNSGGPVIDTNGKVIGVVFATSTTYNNIGYALTAEQATTILEPARSAKNAVKTGNECSQ